MKTGEIIYGFEVLSESEIPEVGGMMHMLSHVKSGAALAYLERDDSNKTFAISFATPPTDDTGVFHIIEHSVLCGSKKYPVKEPFVELLKGSLNTFLNAMTYGDRTVYPVASRCDKDFKNLTDIYLDAVFHPLMLENPNIFYQEGWHHEYSAETDTLSYNGVVYNEMQGAYSSPDELSGAALSKMLFPDNCYSKDSGGDPDAIPTLTYESFVEAHATYYHPSNAQIFLDGSVMIDEILPLIDSYLSEYEKKDINVEFPIHAPVHPDDITLRYEAGAEDADDRAKIAFCYVLGSVGDQLEGNVATLISECIASTNESQLKKKMLDTGLCSDMSMTVTRTNQTMINIDLRGVPESKTEEAKEALERSIREVAAEGLDRKRLAAAVNNIEFKLREKDFGSLPRGVAFALSVYGIWNYGIDPALALDYEDSIRSIRELLDTDRFERDLISFTVDNPHRAAVTLLPDKDEGKRRSARLAERLKNERHLLDDSSLAALREREAKLEEWQNTPDTEENLNTVPALSISDLTIDVKDVKTQEISKDGARILFHDIETDGITYLTLLFPANMLSPDDIFLLGILVSTYKNMPTESYTVSQLQSEIKSSLGSLSVSYQTLRNTRTGEGDLSLSLTASLLDSSKEKLVHLVKELLLTTDFSDTSTLRRLVTQARVDMEEAFASDGLGYAISRVYAAIDPTTVSAEYLSGYEAYKRLCQLDDSFDTEGSDLPVKLRDLAGRLFIKDKMVVSTVGMTDTDFAEKLISLFPDGVREESISVAVLPERRTGIVIPSRVAYAVAGDVSEAAKRKTGALKVVHSESLLLFAWSPRAITY